MPALYLTFKLVHVGAVVLFLGNIFTGVFWKRNADRTHDPRIMANAIEGIIRSDRLFTIPGVVLVVAAGVAAAIAGHFPILRSGWILWSLVLFALSGWAFVAQVAPLERKLLAAAREGAGDSVAESTWEEQYERFSHRWDFWGAVALGAPLVAMILMVVKPPLPGL